MTCHPSALSRAPRRPRLGVYAPYRNGVLEAEGFPVADVSDHLADPSAVVWFDMCEPTAEDLVSINSGLEDGLFEENPKDKQMQIRTFQLRKSLVTLRRVVLPMREVVNSLLRRDLQVIDAEMAPYYQACTTTCRGPRSRRSRCGTW